MTGGNYDGDDDGDGGSSPLVMLMVMVINDGDGGDADGDEGSAQIKHQTIDPGTRHPSAKFGRKKR